MKRVIQQDRTGCGLACVAMISNASYQSVRSAAINSYGLGKRGKFYTSTPKLSDLGKDFGVSIGRRRRKFNGFENLPPLSILSINYDEAENTWHWVVCVKSKAGIYILDPSKKIKQKKRTDLNRISKSATHWVLVE